MNTINESHSSEIIIDKNINVENETTEYNNNILTIPLIYWFEKYKDSIPDYIKVLKLDISDIKKNKYILLKIPSIDGKMELIMYNNADRIPTLDLNISEIAIYNSGIRMIHKLNNNFIKSYIGKRTHIVVSLTNELLIPYYITKIKINHLLEYKKNLFDINSILNDQVNKDFIKTLYPTIKKSEKWSDINTNNDIFKYFIDIQNNNIKNNLHHILLDNIMIQLVSGNNYSGDKNELTHVKYQNI